MEIAYNCLTKFNKFNQIHLGIGLFQGLRYSLNKVFKKLIFITGERSMISTLKKLKSTLLGLTVMMLVPSISAHAYDLTMPGLLVRLTQQSHQVFQ